MAFMRNTSDEMNVIGRVVAVKPGQILFAQNTVEPCSNCNGRCGAMIWKKITPRKPVWFSTDQHHDIDDVVEVAFKSTHFLQCLFILYGTPLAFLIIGLLLGQLLFASELFVFVVGMALFFAGMLVSSRLIKLMLRQHHFKIRSTN